MIALANLIRFITISTHKLQNKVATMYSNVYVTTDCTEGEKYILNLTEMQADT